MRSDRTAHGFTPPHHRGFTLIELLVVIAIIAVLVGILLPSLAGARNEARSLKCAANARSVAQGVAIYQSSFSFFPFSYAYTDHGVTDQPAWSAADQGTTIAQDQAYIHWSYSLLSDGDKIPEEAFKCPSVPFGGAPMTNPGPNATDKESWQTTNNAVTDFQAKRMAYTGNAAIFPRNKLNGTGGQRRNVFVKESAVDNPSTVILATEFFHDSNWRSISTSGNESKSHRSISPFLGGSSGVNVYAEPTFGDEPRFFYPVDEAILPNDQLAGVQLMNDNSGVSVLNAVGRSHPGKSERRILGTANFSFVDGHVERMDVLKSIRKRLWGERFYSLSGSNKVDPTQRVTP
jgi:prepilin-type N-terminal cleavage/methylation domain-containing protein/prepilin-type processing-associated H-X9-DG protein